MFKLFKNLFHGRALTPNEGFGHLNNPKTKEFWVINNSHVLGYGRAQLVFSNVPPSIDMQVDLFPYPPQEDWAHRQGLSNFMQKELLNDTNVARSKGHQLVLEDMWLPVDVLSRVTKEQLSELYEFWNAVNNGSLVVVTSRLADRMIMSEEAYPEIERLAHLQSAISGGGHAIYTDAQLVEVPYSPPSERNDGGILLLKEKAELQKIVNIDKFLGK